MAQLCINCIKMSFWIKYWLSYEISIQSSFNICVNSARSKSGDLSRVRVRL